MTIEMAGKKAKCPFCATVMVVPQTKKPVDSSPYGLSVNNPVLCGGGPPGEQAYLTIDCGVLLELRV